MVILTIQLGKNPKLILKSLRLKNISPRLKKHTLQKVR